MAGQRIVFCGFRFVNNEQKGSNFCLCSHRCLKFNQKSKILLLKVKVSFNRSHRLCIILKVNEKENNNIAEVEDDDIVIICFMISTLFYKDTGPNVEDFQKLLDNNMSIFHITRTAGKLHNHWRLLRHYQLLNCQTGLQFLLKLFEFCCFFLLVFLFFRPPAEKLKCHMFIMNSNLSVRPCVRPSGQK